MRISKIFISHWHGDHSLGLPGLLSSLAMNKRTAPLQIFGPKGTKESVKLTKKAFNLTLPFPSTVKDIEAPKVKEVDKAEDYTISAVKLAHRIPCNAYSFETKSRIKLNKDFLKKHKIKSSPILKKLKEGKSITVNGKKISPKQAIIIEKGKKITFIADTKLCPQIHAIAKDSDILVWEATFSSTLGKKAEEMYHLTAKQAAEIAKKAKAKKLYITHPSQRYESTKTLENEAKKMFKNTTQAKDFLKIKI